MTEQTPVTMLLHKWKEGDQDALRGLMDEIFGDLRTMARARLRSERSNHTWAPTELVHEAFLKLAQSNQIDWQDRTHFFAVIGTIMRRVLIDYARERKREKRGGGAVHLELNVALERAESKNIDLERLDDALELLAKNDEASGPYRGIEDLRRLV